MIKINNNNVAKDIIEDIYEISKLQKKFDDVVLERFPELIGKSNNVVWKINALIVEMGECLQEWRGFKMWSENKEPNVNEMKEEYVDWFHFVVSVGLEFGYDFKNMINNEIFVDMSYKDELQQGNYLDIANKLILEWNRLLFKSIQVTSEGEYYLDSKDYEKLLFNFINIGDVLGFTWEDIYGAYVEKNKENHVRQSNNY